MRDFLTVIHDEFANLYDVVGAEGFGMDIEYKVTAEDQLAKNKLGLGFHFGLILMEIMILA